MHFANLTRWGFVALVAACLASGPLGRYIFLPVVLFIAALTALQVRIPYWARDPRDERWSLLVLLAGQWLLALAVFGFRPLLGTAAFLMGGGLNLLVFCANGLRMPHVGVAKHGDHGHYCPLTKQSRLPFLADRFVSGYRSETECWAFSVGDVLELLGTWTLAAQLVSKGVT